jgi:hypothetical protein
VPHDLALARVEKRDGKIALAFPTSVCKQEMRVMICLYCWTLSKRILPVWISSFRAAVVLFLRELLSCKTVK